MLTHFPFSSSFYSTPISGGIWTCPYTLDSIATINWAVGKSGYLQDYIPPASLPPPTNEEEEANKIVRDPGEVLMEMDVRSLALSVKLEIPTRLVLLTNSFCYFS